MSYSDLSFFHLRHGIGNGGVFQAFHTVTCTNFRVLAMLVEQMARYIEITLTIQFYKNSERASFNLSLKANDLKAQRNVPTAWMEYASDCVRLTTSSI